MNGGKRAGVATIRLCDLSHFRNRRHSLHRELATDIVERVALSNRGSFIHKPHAKADQNAFDVVSAPTHTTDTASANTGSEC